MKQIIRKLIVSIKKRLFNSETCIYCGKEIWEGTPKVYNMLDDPFHDNCWSDFQWD